jgi:hypothetical protein
VVTSAQTKTSIDALQRWIHPPSRSCIVLRSFFKSTCRVLSWGSEEANDLGWFWKRPKMLHCTFNPLESSKRVNVLNYCNDTCNCSGVLYLQKRSSSFWHGWSTWTERGSSTVTWTLLSRRPHATQPLYTCSCTRNTPPCYIHCYLVAAWVKGKKRRGCRCQWLGLESNEWLPRKQRRSSMHCRGESIHRAVVIIFMFCINLRWACRLGRAKF